MVGQNRAIKGVGRSRHGEVAGRFEVQFGVAGTVK